jgi:leucyl-tRNA synthetase
MSKSLRNVVNPDDVVEKHGADSLRLYEMFMGPLEATKPWQTSGLDGQNRFLQKVYRNFIGEENKTIEVVNDEPPKELHRLMHETILKIESDIENLRFNTSISQLMILNNEICKQDQRYREVQETFTQLLAPFAPHLAEELWEYLGKKDLSFSPWPLGDPAKAVKDEVVIVFQINGKVKCKVELPKQTPKNELEDIAKNHEKFKTYLENVQIIKAIAVPGKLVNFVVKPN